MLRIIGGKVFSDWPWCVAETENGNVALTTIVHHVLDYISDMRDSVFLVGSENSRLPWHHSFPYISNSPHMAFADIPWPW